MSKDNHKELGEILRHYREHADAAWSEVTDKVHTVEEYHEALEKITKGHAIKIEDFYRNKILEARIDEHKIIFKTYADWYNRMSKEHGVEQPVPHTAFHRISKERLKDITAQFNSKGDSDE